MTRYTLEFPAADRSTSGQAQQLAKWTGESVPAAVQALEELLERNDLWHLFSRNEDAFNCAQAARVRQCLGQSGIPLDRELKSFLGYFVDEAGHRQKVAVHCRGGDHLDLQKAREALQITGDITRLETRDPDDPDSAGDSGLYGLVNPFTLEIASLNGDVTFQLFDEHLFFDTDVPATIMTNAGDRTWSVEFQMADLVRLIPARRCGRADVVQPARHVVRPSIGILTGNSPESGALLWERLTELIRRRRESLDGQLTGDIYLPKVLIRSVPAMGMTMELHLRKEQVWHAISRDIERMCVELRDSAGGSTSVLSIACNTTPYYAPGISEIAHRYGVRFVSIAEAVEQYLDEKGIDEIVLLGIGYVHRPELSGYARLFERAHFTIHPLSEKALAAIEKLAFDVKRGRPIHECSQELRNLLRRHGLLKKSVVVALTELSLIVVRAHWAENRKSETQLIDAVEVYAELLADIFMGSKDASTLQPISAGTVQPAAS